MDDPTVSVEQRQKYPEYYGQNICKAISFLAKTADRLVLNKGPKGDVPEIQGFEEAFKDLGR